VRNDGQAATQRDDVRWGMDTSIEKLRQSETRYELAKAFERGDRANQTRKA